MHSGPATAWFHDRGIVLDLVKREVGPDDAAERFRTVLRLDPGHAGAHRNLGLALARSSRPCEAAEQLELSMQLEPSAAANPRLSEEIERLRGLCRTTGPTGSPGDGR